MAARKAKKSSNKGPGSDFGPLLGNPKPPKKNTGPTKSQQQASRILFGPQNANIQEMGVGGYKSAAVRAARTIANFIKNQSTYYGVHGSSETGLTKIVPRTGPLSTNQNKTTARLYGASAVPKGNVTYSFPAKTPESEWARGYGRLGSTYVVKGKVGNISTPVWNVAERMSSKPTKVIKEFSSSVTSEQMQRIVGRAVTKDKIVSRGTVAAGVVGGAAAIKQRKGKQRKGGTRTRGSKAVKRK